MRVAIPSHLADYTAGARQVEAHGEDLASLLEDLDRRYPGLRFRIVDEQDRIRPHIKLFVDQAMAESLGQPVSDGQLVTIVAALSGG
jgi:molybdopterin converting factor small subunit